MRLRLRNVEREKKKSSSFLPPWEFQTPISTLRALDPFLLLGDPGLLISLPRNWLSFVVVDSFISGRFFSVLIAALLLISLLLGPTYGFCRFSQCIRCPLIFNAFVVNLLSHKPFLYVRNLIFRWKASFPSALVANGKVAAICWVRQNFPSVRPSGP